MYVKHAILPVDDIDRAVAFYTGKLRLTLVADVGQDRAGRLELAFPSGQVGLLLEQRTAPCSSHAPALVVGVPDVEMTFERLDTLGVLFLAPPAECPRQPGTRFATFRDSEGNLVRIESA